MTEKLYCINNRQPEKIIPYRVDRETDKMFYAHEIQYANGEEIPDGWSRSIKKSVMHLDWHGHFYATLEEAKAERIRLIKNRIVSDSAQIEQYKKRIADDTELLKKLEAKDEC